MDELESTQPAGFWMRAAALAVDVLVYLFAHAAFKGLARMLWGPGPGGNTAAEGAVALFILVFALAYTTTLHIVAGATIGKALLGMRVVLAADGAPITFGPAFLRHLAYFVSAMPLGFGFFMAGMRRDKRALHDLIAGTRVERTMRRRVVRRPAVPVQPPSGTLQEPAVSHRDD